LLFAVVGLGFAAGPAQAVLQTTVTVQSAQLVHSSEVRVAGTITCPGEFIMRVRLQQGRQPAEGFGLIDPPQACSAGEPDTWTVTVSGRPFKHGKALVFADETECDPDGCSQDTDERTIRIRR
jgi:hypothetical protein